MGVVAQKKVSRLSTAYERNNTPALHKYRNASNRFVAYQVRFVEIQRLSITTQFYQNVLEWGLLLIPWQRYHFIYYFCYIYVIIFALKLN